MKDEFFFVRKIWIKFVSKSFLYYANLSYIKFFNLSKTKRGVDCIFQNETNSVLFDDVRKYFMLRIKTMKTRMDVMMPP